MAEKRRKRKWLRWTLAGIALAVLAFVIVSWMLFQHIPSWYTPTEVPPDRVQAVQSDLARMADTLNERMVRADEPFEIRISAEQVNAWLGAREDMWPLSREWLPEGVSDPFVVIDEQGIRLAATVRQGAIQTVLSVRLAVTADEESVRVRLLEVNSGSLPVPRVWVESQLVKFQQHTADWLASLDDAAAYKDLQIGELYEGVSFANRGVWRQADVSPRPFRVIGLQLEEGALVITVRPWVQRTRSGGSYFNRDSR